MISTPLPHALDRTILIRAPREGIFRYFTDSRRFAAWWGAGSSIDPRPGGRVAIRYPNGVEAGGEVLEIDPPARIVFSYGYASGEPIALGASRVTIELAEEAAGTRVSLRHELADAAVRDQHVAGWRHQMAVFANVVSDEHFASVAERIDGWHAAWGESDPAARRAQLEAVARPEITFLDRWGCVAGLAEVDAHVAAVLQLFPGCCLERTGPVRHCQGTAVSGWVARKPDGTEIGRGTNVFTLAADGRIAGVVGIWEPPPTA